METSDIDSNIDSLEDGYSQAKWVAEKLVWEAVSRGLPVCIYRPGNIGHHSVTGIANPNDFQTMIIDACNKVNCAPQQVNWAFEMTPVDFLVKAIRLFASQASSFGTVFNVVNNKPIPAGKVFDLMQEKKAISERVFVEEWKSRLLKKAYEDGDYILNVLAQSIEDIEPYLLNEGTYDCSRFENALLANGIVRPTLDVDYFHKVLSRNVELAESVYD